MTQKIVLWRILLKSLWRIKNDIYVDRWEENERINSRKSRKLCKGSEVIVHLALQSTRFTWSAISSTSLVFPKHLLHGSHYSPSDLWGWRWRQEVVRSWKSDCNTQALQPILCHGTCYLTQRTLWLWCGWRREKVGKRGPGLTNTSLTLNPASPQVTSKIGKSESCAHTYYLWGWRK